jgi:hypothetical protein
MKGVLPEGMVYELPRRVTEAEAGYPFKIFSFRSLRYIDKREKNRI